MAWSSVKFISLIRLDRASVRAYTFKDINGTGNVMICSSGEEILFKAKLDDDKQTCYIIYKKKAIEIEKKGWCVMTQLRKDAMDLLERIPDDKLIFVIQIMQGMNGLYASNDEKEREAAFERLEALRKKVPDLDYDKELKEYREGKYEYENIDWYKCDIGLSLM